MFTRNFLYTSNRILDGSAIESARRIMRLYRNMLIHIFAFLLVKSVDSFEDAGKYPSSLERKLTLKLKTATRLKHNFGKILHELPVRNYELYCSIKTVENYLKNGGSLVECLDILPSITYVPIAEQIDGILDSMEDHLPEYLMPAISLIRRSLSEGILDANEIYRPTWGPPNSDPLEKIPLRELKEAASPLTYPKTVNALKGPWPKIVGEAASLINYKIISPRQKLIVYMLANLKIPGANAEVRESIAHLVEYLQLNGEHELDGFRMSNDPYELVANVISSLSLRNESLIAANLLLSFLKKPSECREDSKLANLFKNNVLNYSLLISQERIISKSKAGVELLSMIQQNNENVRDTVEQFLPFEHTSWRDLLLAFVSQLRRYQGHRGKVLNVVDSVYGDLILKDTQKRWGLLRNQIIMKTILSAIEKKESSLRIKRLLTDVSTDRSIEPQILRKALAFGSSEDVDGPIDAALKTLKALLISEFLPSGVLKANIDELMNAYNRTNEVSECDSLLEIYLANFTNARKDIRTGNEMKDIDVEDLLQALPDLDIYTDEYRNLKGFLSRNDLELRIGQVDVKAHPTRGRFLSQLLQMTEYSENVDDNLRSLAKQFVDDVAYEGYGAGALLRRSS